MRRGLAAAGAAALVGAGVLVPGGPAAAAVPPDDLPSGVAPASLRDPAQLPAAAGWPLADPFPRTSGTGRYVDGAFGWSDFLYDAAGPGLGVFTTPPTDRAALAPTAGFYDHPADRPNASDVARVALGVDGDDLLVRVDWQSMTEPDDAIAVLGVDTDASGGPALPFPAGAGVSAAGLERSLVMTASGSRLVDAVTGLEQDVASLGGSTTVDEDAQSFVVRLPRDAVGPDRAWRLWLVSGLHDGDGGFGSPSTLGLPPELSLPAVQPRVYNATFRGYDDETPSNNFWFDAAQSLAIAQGDVSAFSVDVSVPDLVAGRTTPEPQPTGYSNRWYVSSLELGDGYVAGGDPFTGDLEPDALDRVQPYGVYVPTGYDPSDPAPLTWLLHSLGVNHNQYGALNPTQVQQSCEDRGSVCATTLARGADTWYFDEAEVDFWEVWRDLADTYALDPERTVSTGYSMGGFATYRWLTAYPDAFSQGLALAAPPTCGVRVSGDVRSPAGPGRCTTDSDTTPLLGNLRNLELEIGHGVVDELVPIPSVLEHVAAADEAGLRYRYNQYPARGAPRLGRQRRVHQRDGAARARAARDVAARRRVPLLPEPGRARAGHRPGRRLLADRAGGTGRVARHARPGGGGVARRPGSGDHAGRGDRPARAGRPLPGAGDVRGADVGPRGDAAGAAAGGPDLRERRGPTADLADAGLAPSGPGLVPVATDGPLDLTLAGLMPGTPVLLDGASAGAAGDDGRALVRLAEDGEVCVGSCPQQVDADDSDGSTGGPTTGGTTGTPGTGGSGTGGTTTHASGGSQVLAATGAPVGVPAVALALLAGGALLRARRG